jgi:hypothetical protein
MAMADEKKKAADEESQEGLGILSRREFLGATAAALPPLMTNPQNSKLKKTDEVAELLDERHILDEDITKVIEHAESTGEKLYQTDTNRFLSKLWVKSAYFYVEYSIVEGGYQIHTAYSHRFDLEED